MSDMSLVVKQGSLADMESALGAAHDAIVKQVHDVLEQVNARIQGWDPATASRAAEMDYQRRLGDGVEATVRKRTGRCVLITRAQPGLAKDVPLYRALLRDRDGDLGVYLDPQTSGSVAPGDAVELLDG